MYAVLLALLLPSAVSEPTYANQVVRALQKNCQICHHPGTAAPFSLVSYEDALKWADNMQEAVSERRMPPWFADPNVGKFANDRSLSSADREVLLRWIGGRRLRGNDRDLPPPVKWQEGWLIGKPDVIIDMPGGPQEIPPGGTVDYKWLTGVVPGNDDLWITHAEIQPGCRQVVHHCQLYTRESQIISYAPGTQPVELPPDTIVRIHGGQPMTWLMHYTPYGKPARDRTRLGLKLWKGKKPPKYIRRIVEIQTLAVDIPPYSNNTKVENQWTSTREDTELIAILPHMHVRGKNFRLDVNYPDGRSETPLVVPRYDFAWQTFYEFADSMHLPRGTTLHFTSHYDNSTSNPANPDPSKHVRWGNQTTDEMQTVTLVYREPFDPKAPDGLQESDIFIPPTILPAVEPAGGMVGQLAGEVWSVVESVGYPVWLGAGVSLLVLVGTLAAFKRLRRPVATR
jgi:hypothetical protein